MANINITGDATGKWNTVWYDSTNPTNISTFDSSIVSIIRHIPNTQASLQEYKPSALIKPFTQFEPGSGYFIKANANFTIPQNGNELALSSSLSAVGDPIVGKFNIFKYNFISAQNIADFTSNIFLIQRHTPSQYGLQEYRPEALIKPYTTFEPGSGYLIRARNNFLISGILPFPTYSLNPQNTNVSEGASVVYTLNTTNVPNATTFYWQITSTTPNIITSQTNPFPTFSFALSGSGAPEEDPAREINIQNTAAYTDKIYYDAWPGTTSLYTAMEIRVNGIPRTLVNFTTDRLGTNFGYSIGTTANAPEITSTFQSGVVSLSTNDFINPQTGLQGTVTINNGTGLFAITPRVDSFTEGNEPFRVNIRTGSHTGPIVAASNGTIIDTSQNPTYSAGFDNAAQPLYSDGWQSGDNGGIPIGTFTPWTVYASQNPGVSANAFIGNPAIQGFGDINTAGVSWGLIAAGSGNYMNAERGLVPELSVGSTLSGVIAAQWRSGSKGFDLYNSNTAYSTPNKLITFNVSEKPAAPLSGGYTLEFRTSTGTLSTVYLENLFPAWDYRGDSRFQFFAYQKGVNEYDFRLTRPAGAGYSTTTFELSSLTGRVRGCKFYIGDTGTVPTNPNFSRNYLYLNSLRVA